VAANHLYQEAEEKDHMQEMSGEASLMFECECDRLDLQRRGHNYDCLWLLEKRKSFVVQMPLEDIINSNINDILFDELVPLIKSIKTHGIIVPIVVNKFVRCYEVIDGRRRVEAAKHLGYKTIRAEILV
jgi:hypothetical protein